MGKVTATDCQNLADHQADSFNLPLHPFVYDSISIEKGHRPIGFRFAKHVVNIIAKINGHELIVCGEANSLELAQAKAFSELMERSALIQFGAKYHAENSNGWAAYPDRITAKSNAIFELVERDAVLSQWYTAARFRELDQTQWPLEIQHWAMTELTHSEFPKMKILLSTQGLGPSVTVLFINDLGFGVSAHATRTTLAESITSAITEACRPAHASIRRAHWKDTLKLKAGHGAPSAPDAHAVYYAYHEPFPKWIYGEGVSWDEALKLWDTKMAKLLRDENQFEFTTVMEEPLYVGFVKHPRAFHLRWGTTDPEWVSMMAGAKRLGLSSNQINKEVHIVS